MTTTDSSRPSYALAWLSATRPRTLPAAIAPVLVGSALAYHEGRFHALAALLCLVFALLAQIAANFANDYFDFLKGADTSKRVGPKRAVASGWITPGAMRNATISVCAVAFLVGLCLLPFGGWPLLVIGISSLICAVAYTGGPYPLGYHGLGDLFVFIFFGLIAVSATAYVQCGYFQFLWLLPATAIGLLSVNILIVNNYRDLETDVVAGKRTLVVRFGRPFARKQFAANHGFALLTPFLLAAAWSVSVLWLPLLVAPLLALALQQHRRLDHEQGPAAMIALLGDTGKYLALYALLLSAWIVF